MAMQRNALRAFDLGSVFKVLLHNICTQKKIKQIEIYIQMGNIFALKLKFEVFAPNIILMTLDSGHFFE